MAPSASVLCRNVRRPGFVMTSHALSGTDGLKGLVGRSRLSGAGAVRRIFSSRLGLFGEEAGQPVAHHVGLFRGPFAKSFAGFHAELAGCDLVAEERVRSRGVVKIAIEHLRDVELKI